MTDGSPDGLPAWLADPEAVGPCPCGQPVSGPMVLLVGETGLRYLYHVPCIRRFVEVIDE